MTVTSLVTGTRATQREAAIAALLDPDQSTAVILEGLSDGNDILASISSPRLNVIRIAPGCMHCIGNLVMRVTLNRILRERPQRLFISIANDEHIEQLRAFLVAPPYEALLELTDNIVPASS
ncbi:GTPase [Oxalicibacterium solurbis]|uniref:GTPase n=1 Tax=Oxalicibacterium solurbis TaxID=69280 RepID=A0A8J3AXF1_9BURK|nr:GTPase [Oxalicibacterium solurbis]GGI55299.1 hypothetical protein GCM10011430_24730 [Oxalicibacterium solurbis]